MSRGEVPPEYLGDGVYASFDGYQIWLAANHHENKVVALEPAVMRALVAYQARVDEWCRADREPATTGASHAD